MTTYRYTFTVDIEDPSDELIDEIYDHLKPYGNAYQSKLPQRIDVDEQGLRIVPEPATHADVIQSHTDLDGRIEALEEYNKSVDDMALTVSGISAHLEEMMEWRNENRILDRIESLEKSIILDVIGRLNDCEQVEGDLDGRLDNLEKRVQAWEVDGATALRMENAGLRGERDREKERADTLANRLEMRDQ